MGAGPAGQAGEGGPEHRLPSSFPGPQGPQHWYSEHKWSLDTEAGLGQGGEASWGRTTEQGDSLPPLGWNLL